MKTFPKILICTVLCAVSAACSKDVGAGAGDTIRLWSGVADHTAAQTKSGTTRELKPLLVFWTDGHFDDSAVGEPHFFTRIPELPIDRYEQTPYNTRVYYPNNQTDVHVAGLIPAPAAGVLTPTVAGSYASFDIVPGDGVTDDEYGVLDVLAAGTQTANSAAPFSAAQKLTFRHALTKLIFSARLSKSMSKYVKYVTVKFLAELTPSRVVWDAAAGAYVPAAGGAESFVFGNYWSDDGVHLADNDRANGSFFYQVSKDYYLDLGYTLILPPGDHLDFIVQYRVADNMSDFDTHPVEELRLVEVPVRIQFPDGNNGFPTLGANESYHIHLILDLYDIHLTGKLLPWEDGGFVSVPVHPTL